MINDSDSKHTLELRYKNVTAKILMESFVIIIQSQIKDALLLVGFSFENAESWELPSHKNLIFYCPERQLARQETRVSWIINNI